MKLFIELISISAIIISFTFIYGAIKRYIHFKSSITSDLIMGFSFALISVIGMLFPVELSPGVIIDGRTVIVSLSAIFGGVSSSIITAAVTGLYRIYLGGVGLTAGLASIGLAVLNGVFFLYLYKKKILKNIFVLFIFLGIGNAVLGTVTTFLLPDWDFALQIIKKMIVPIHLFFPSIALFLGAMLKKETDNQETRKALIESERKYKELVENSPDLHYRTDKNGTIVFVSNNIVKYTGHSVEEVIGSNIESYFLHSSRDKKKFFEKLDTEKAVHNYEILLTKKDETMWWGSISAHSKISEEGSFLGIEGSVRDVSDQRKMKQVLIQSEKILSIGGLAAGMAHEINNPLAGMMQSANVVVNRLTNPELVANKKAAEELDVELDKIHQYIEKRGIPRIVGTMMDSGKRVAAVVDNMLNYARKQDDHISTVNLVELIDQTLLLTETDFSLKEHYDFKNINIIKCYPEVPVFLNCVRESIQQVLLNILRNGFQAMMEKKKKQEDYTPSFSISLFRNESDNYASLTIEDNGPGMDEDTKNRIFDPFFTTKQKGFGTGLGLSVSSFIIKENHEGELLVDSELGKGTVFTINLPL